MGLSIYEIAAAPSGAGKSLEMPSDPAGKGEDFARVLGDHDIAGVVAHDMHGKDTGVDDPKAAVPAEAPGSGESAEALPTVSDEGGEQAPGAFDGGSVDADISGEVGEVVGEGVPEGEVVVSEEPDGPVAADNGQGVEPGSEGFLGGIENAISKIRSNAPEAAGKALEVLTDGPASGHPLHPNGGVPANANIETPIAPVTVVVPDAPVEAGSGDIPPLEDAQPATGGGGWTGSGALTGDNAGSPVEGLPYLNGQARPAPATVLIEGGQSEAQASAPQATPSGASIPSGASASPSESTMYGYELLDKVARALGELALSARADGMNTGKKASAKAAAPVVHVKDVPADLGEIILKLDGESKGAGLKIVVQSAAVKELLESDPSRLRAVFAGKGIWNYSIEVAADVEGTESSASLLGGKGPKGPSMTVVTLATDDVVRATSAGSVSARPGNVVIATGAAPGANAKAPEAVEPPVQPPVQASMVMGRAVDAPAHHGGERTYGIDNAILKISANAPESAGKALEALAGGPVGVPLRALTGGPVGVPLEALTDGGAGGAAEVLRAVRAVEAAVRMADAGGTGNASKGTTVNGVLQTQLNPGGAVNPDGTLNPGGLGSMGEALNPGGGEADVSTAFGNGGNGGNGSFTPGEQSLKYDNAGRLIEFVTPLSKGAEGLLEVSAKEGPARGSTLPAAHRFEVFEKFGHGLRMSIAGGGKEVRIKLVPSHLGEIILKVSGKENDVSVKIMVENIAVKGLLESDAGRLKTLFSENGLELNDYSVEVGSHGSRAHDENPWLSAKGEGLDHSATGGEEKAPDDEIGRLPYMPYGDMGLDNTGSVDLFA